MCVDKVIKKKWMAMGIGLSVLSLMVNVQAEQIHYPSDWAVGDLQEAEANELLPEAWQYTLHSTITEAQFNEILEAFEKKLVQIGGTKVSEIDKNQLLTREGVLTKYYQLLTAYDLEIDHGVTALEYMIANQIITPDEKGSIRNEDLCTVQEACLFANRIINHIYRVEDKGSKGYVWEVVKNNHTMYLLGTIHMAEEKFYPLNHKLNEMIQEVDEVIFEVDFYDQAGIDYMIEQQKYVDGTTLESMMGEEDYEVLITELEQIGVGEEEIMQYKPWGLSNYLTSLFAKEEEIENEIPIFDKYIYVKSILQGKEISELESYAYQIAQIETVSIEEQVEQLKDDLSRIIEAQENEKIKEETSNEASHWVDHFILGNEVFFRENYRAYELGKPLANERNEQMTSKLIKVLNDGSEKRSLVVLNAAYLVGETGILQALETQGYTVKHVY